MRVRPATPEDRPAVRDCHVASVQAFGRDGYDDEQVRSWANADDRSPEDYDVDAEGEHFTVALREGERSEPSERASGGTAGHAVEQRETAERVSGGTASRNGEVAGFGHFVEGEADRKGEVHAVYVHPDHAGRGVGSALLAELEGYARGRGLDALALQSSRNAVGFYERAGYERVAEGESPGGLPVVEMRKEL